ncbi:uncharacterized protein [Asterias amurensis]|uniref:uncharacterized protein n=1 Tax=Asterias amurensis TaxID=7602 RepID=UPI003AB5A837
MGERATRSDSRRTMLVICVVMLLAGSTNGLVRQRMPQPSKTSPQPDIDTTEETFPETRDLDQQVLKFLKDNHYAGATLGVAHGDRVVYTQGYGQTDEGAPMKPTTLQPISSLSKTITAVTVLKLVELGNLHLSDTVFGPDGILTSFQPASNDGRRVDPRLYDITVEHLLHHTAGWSQTTSRLYDPMMNSVYLSRGHDVVNIADEMGLNRDLTPSDVISYMMRQPLSRAPGIKYEYSNFGYCVLGRVIETISKDKYVSFVRAQVLKPLGMWRTRIGPHRLIEAGHNNHVPAVSFAEGNIPLTDGDGLNSNTMSYNLLDSSLGWWSTTYDLMRFVTGLTSGMVLNSDSLKLLTKHPNPPASEHRDTWHGLGVHVNNNQAWWQQGDSHDNEIMLFHQESQITKSRFGRKHKSDSQSWVVILSDNNRKNVQQVFGGMMSSLTEWPSENLLIEDCGEYLARESWRHYTLMNSKIGENQFPLLVEAVSRLYYYPEWINAYNVNHKTYIAAVFQRQTNGNFTSHKLAHGVTNTELYNINLDNLIEGFFLNFVTSYSSFNYNGQIRFTATFSKTPSNNTYRLGGTLRESTASLNAQNYVPSIQSVASLDGVRHFTYSLNTAKVKSWTSYDNLTMEELQLQIRTNANMDRVLEYLDSYDHLGQVLFSAVFTPGKAVKWQVQTDVRHNELAQQSYMFRGLRFRPKIIVGYECNGHPCFVLMWKKH